MISPSYRRAVFFTAFAAVSLLPLLVQAEGETGSNRIDTDQCPENVEAEMVYSPFKPYFKFDKFKGDRQKCWVAADCVFEAAGESRKQQMAAIALVMGLIPLTLKDIAWPERRVIPVTNRLNWIVEIFVLALGLVPDETGLPEKTRERSAEGNYIAEAAWGLRKAGVVLWVLGCTIIMLLSYGGLTFMEIYSKRSALGCPFPFFVAAWYVVALVPASIHSLFAALRRMRYTKKLRLQPPVHAESGITQYDATKTAYTFAREAGNEDPERKNKIISAVQGADEDWPVQLAWGIYYISGTLIFTSIMAVTVIELVCWVGLGFAVTGSSKLLAFFLCLVFEETGVKKQI